MKKIYVELLTFDHLAPSIGKIHQTPEAAARMYYDWQVEGLEGGQAPTPALIKHGCTLIKEGANMRVTIAPRLLQGA